MKKIFVILMFALCVISLNSCMSTSPNCLTRESNRFQAQDNRGSRTPHCLTPECQRFQGR